MVYLVELIIYLGVVTVLLLDTRSTIKDGVFSCCLSSPRGQTCSMHQRKKRKVTKVQIDRTAGRNQHIHDQSRTV